MTLRAIRIDNFAIVESLELQLTPGLTVITGETGAGKSILVDALTLALGARADSGWIRHDAQHTEISVVFDITGNEDARQWLREQDLLADDDECLIRRTSYRDKASRAFINDRPVTVQALRRLGNHLVDIHGQHEHQSLLRADTQRQILDDYLSISGEVERIEALRHSYRAASEQLATSSERDHHARERVELLRFQLEELAQLEEQDFEDIEQEHARLAHASELKQGMHAALHELYEADNGTAVQTLSRAADSLGELSNFEPALKEVVELLRSAMIQSEEAANQLRHMADAVDLDPAQLARVEAQLASWLALARKHRCAPAELAPMRDRLNDELRALDDADGDLEALRREKERLRDEYDRLAAQLSADRLSGATDLSAAITEQMQQLGMAGGRFEIHVETDSAGEPTPYGRDRIRYRVTTNPGQPLQDLTRVASGGELSRISLAIAVVTTAVGRVPTMIFDEVDVGIGGGTAEIVGQRLRELAGRRQVLCITHLPQVAALGQSHLTVRKHAGDQVSVSIAALTEDQRIDEVARMLGGVEITDRTIAHAADMLGRAVP